MPQNIIRILNTLEFFSRIPNTKNICTNVSLHIPPDGGNIVFYILFFSYLRLIFACDFHLPFLSVLPKSAKCIKNVLFESENK